MKEPSTPPLWPDIGAGFLLVGLAAADAANREAYHQVSAESVDLMLASGLLLLLATSAWLLLRARWPGHSARISSRVVTLASLIGAGLVSLGGTPLKGLGLSAGAAYGLLAGAGLLGAGLVTFLPHPLWARLRLSLVAGFTLFVLSAPIIGFIRAEPMAWPKGATPAPDSLKSVSIVLLLDEMNASQAPAFVHGLSEQGLTVHHTAVESVGSSTTNVLPSLFAGQTYHEAKPCSPTIACDKQRAIDFSRITASRPDIDVVGFFQPYCSIQGLRTCFRGSIPLAIFNIERIRCGLWRRIGLPRDVTESHCRSVYIRSWGDMTDAVVRAVQEAPALQKGGLLFAHIPLPHPPGPSAEGKLPDHYRTNIDRAVKLVRRLISKAQSSGLQPQVLIFSDHPLRQQQWCTSFAPYAWDGCQFDESLVDQQVPIIVAGARPPDLKDMKSNLNVFELIPLLR